MGGRGVRRQGSRRAIVAILLVVVAGCGSTAPSVPGPSVAPSVGPTASGTAQTPSASVSPSPVGSARPTASGADVALEPMASGLVAPVAIVASPDGSGRLFVADQTGLVLVVRDGAVQSRPFLDLRGKVVPLQEDYDERGLIGLAFDPAFARTGRFFVYYAARLRPSAAPGMDHTDVLAEYHADPAADVADADSGRTILAFEQPQPNHMGGALGFGPDGLLYLGAGDGGGEGDASPGHSKQGNAQDLSKLNGKVMRIDVNGRRPYAIPADNPFVDVPNARPEIYAYGFRNPWRLSWEPDGARRLIVSEVGYGRYEEIDVVTAGGNYGWRIREGAHCLDVAAPLSDLATCPTTGARGDPLIDPVVEYTHSDVGVAVVGGYVYRGSAIPGLRGTYVFADFSREWNSTPAVGRGSLLDAVPASNGPWSWRKLNVAGSVGRFVTGIGEDDAGELYLATRFELGPTGTTGQIFRIEPAPTS